MAGNEVSRRTLERTPEKVLTLLRGVGTCPAAHALLVAAGFDLAARDEGWALLRASAEPLRTGELPAPSDTLTREAFSELGDWCTKGLMRVGAALTRLHPEQASFVLAGLKPTKGPDALLVIVRLLARLDQLEKGRCAETRKADQAAMATLAKRGITGQERARLASLVEAAQSPRTYEPAVEPDAAEAQQQRQALLGLYAWYTDWATTARTVISRRDHLIRLGLARKRSQPGEELAAGAD